MMFRRRDRTGADSAKADRAFASGPGAVAVGGDNSAPITTTVYMPGSGRSGIWLETTEFFRPHTGTSLYSLDWALIGRDRELQDLGAWLVGDAQNVALVDGRGGSGKSRLLRAFADAAAERGYSVRFLDRSFTAEPADIEVLPQTDRLLVVVDDAHEAPAIETTAAGILRGRPATKILLSTRPYGVEKLLSDLRHVGLHPTDVPHWRLEDLTFAEATDLSAAVLGAGHDPDVARRLAIIGHDCPLIIVVGGGLIRQGLLDPGRMANDDRLREEVMRRFARARTGDATGAESAVRLEVEQAVAALQPFRLVEPEFRQAAEALTGKAFDQVLVHLRFLESSGVLLRRGDAMRIVPDLLGDAILTDAIVDIPSGAPTTYLDRVLQVADGDVLLHLVTNASRVDWDVRRPASVQQLSLVDSLWTTLVARFEAAEPLEQLILLRRLRRIPFYQRAPLLRISQRAYDTAQLTDVDPYVSDEILAALPPVLHNAATGLDQLAESVDLLWKLAARQQRTDQRQDSPLQILQELAGFERSKHLAFNVGMVEAVKRWITQSRGHRPTVSPLEILRPMLATQTREHTSDGSRVTVRQRLLDRDAVTPTRRAAVDIILDGLCSPDRWEAARAAEVVSKALVYPHIVSGYSIPHDQMDGWTVDFLETLRLLHEVVATVTLDPVVAVALRKSLTWHARHGHGGTQPAARAVLDALPDSIDYELAVALHDGAGELVHEESDFQEALRIRSEKLEVFARVVVATWRDSELLENLARSLSAEQDAALSGRDANPEPFARALVQQRPSLGRSLVAAVIREPAGPLTRLLPVAVQVLLLSDADVGWEAVATLLNGGDLELTRLATAGLHRFRGGQATIDDRERAAVNELLSHEDEVIRLQALQVVRQIGGYDKPLATELLLSVSFEHSTAVAERVLSAFGAHGYLAHEDLGDADRERFLTEIAGLATIDGYAIHAFLADLSAIYPDEVLQLLKRRSAAETRLPTAHYRALPDRWHKDLRLRDSPRIGELLWDALTWIAENIDGSGGIEPGAVFAAVAVTYDGDVLPTLHRALGVGTSSYIEAVGETLEHAHRTFVWEHPDFVTEALHAADKHDEQCRRLIRRRLHDTVRKDGFGGPVGEPAPQHLEQRDRSRTVAATLTEGSPEREFYDAVASAADAEIRSEAEHDRRYLEPRDW